MTLRLTYKPLISLAALALSGTIALAQSVPAADPNGSGGQRTSTRGRTHSAATTAWPRNAAGHGPGNGWSRHDATRDEAGDAARNDAWPWQRDGWQHA